MMRKWFAALFLSSGAALLAYIGTGISMLATTFVIVTCAVVVGTVIWRKSGDDQRRDLRRRLGAGLIAGVVATLCYDVFRFILIKVTGIHFWPFDIFHVFGRGLLGEEAVGLWVSILGFLFHVANGVGFAVAYAVAFGHKGILYGIIWALILEAMMVTVYPGWLGLKALGEFLSVSVFGHLVYGVCIGYISRRFIVR
jgi:hypothetical protein